MSVVKILPAETQIVGAWIVEHGKVRANTVAQRIEELINYYLLEVAVSEDGWSKLFRDPNDGRFWELTYPESFEHGGGAPQLRHVSYANALKRYSI
jgi:hypothetical protein